MHAEVSVSTETQEGDMIVVQCSVSAAMCDK
jgi:hypothetical protein